MPILITAGSSADAFKVQRILQTEAKVLFGEHEGFPVPLFMKDTFVKIPKGTSATFIHEILALCLDLGVEQIYPLRADELRPLSEAKELFSEFGIFVCIPPLRVLDQYAVIHKTTDSQILQIHGPDAARLADRQLNEGIFVLDQLTGTSSLFGIG